MTGSHLEEFLRKKCDSIRKQAGPWASAFIMLFDSKLLVWLIDFMSNYGHPLHIFKLKTEGLIFFVLQETFLLELDF